MEGFGTLESFYPALTYNPQSFYALALKNSFNSTISGKTTPTAANATPRKLTVRNTCQPHYSKTLLPKSITPVEQVNSDLQNSPRLSPDYSHIRSKVIVTKISTFRKSQKSEELEFAKLQEKVRNELM